MTDAVDDLFDFEALQEEKYEAPEVAEVEKQQLSEERDRALHVTHPQTELYLQELLTWLNWQVDNTLANVSGEQDVGLLRGLGMVKAKIQTDQSVAKGVLGNG